MTTYHLVISTHFIGDYLLMKTISISMKNSHFSFSTISKTALFEEVENVNTFKRDNFITDLAKKRHNNLKY